MRNIKPKKNARPRIDFVAAPLEEEMIGSIEGGAGERERRRHNERRQRRIERGRLGKRGNGKRRGDHDRWMGDIDDVEQPERDRQP